MTRLILIALLALPAAPATAGDLLPPCCAGVERPLPRSGQARTWFRDANPDRLGVAVARGPATDMQGFMAASGLTSSVGDGCGPVALRPRTRVIPGA